MAQEIESPWCFLGKNIKQLRDAERMAMDELWGMQGECCGMYRGAEIHIFVKGAKQLVNLCIYSYSYWGEVEYPHNNSLGLSYVQSKDFVFVQFAEYLSLLEHLTLDVGLFSDKEVFNKVPILSNLKHLSLTSCLRGDLPRIQN
ncbi:hypothetical protein DM860_010114 [Cuscuta australis]|uniref:Uncharacterized protein n=1 Tax=Cuscuta australis TaxID=267555 RepID=A0A328D836_9ASTE|nr:hypothetical protein DM860_010114 [Cuscuta australis]